MADTSGSEVQAKAGQADVTMVRCFASHLPPQTHDVHTLYVQARREELNMEEGGKLALGVARYLATASFWYQGCSQVGSEEKPGARAQPHKE